MKIIKIENFENCFMETNDTTCYSIVNEPNITNSNCAIIKSAREIIVIDPGGSSAQAQLIEKFILQFANVKTVYVLLTHCHIDHSINLFRLIKNKKINFKTIMTAKTAEIFSAKNNREILLEDFFNIEMPKYFPDIILPEINENFDYSQFEKSHNIKISIKKCPAFVSADIQMHQLIIGDIKIEAVYTPGHSPDSVCYRVEDILFSGDILFAANNGIAGTIGWSYKDLKLTLSVILNCLKFDKCINYIFSGHGIIFDKIQALKAVEKIYSNISALENIKLIDNQRKKQLIETADILLKESEKMFSIIAGRLHRIEYYLTELDEQIAAEKIAVIIDFNIIDEYISDFRDFIVNYKKNNLPEPVIFLKGIEFAFRLKKIFDIKLLNDIIDSYYLRLCECMINTYLKIVSGRIFKNPPAFVPSIIIDSIVNNIKSVKNKKNEIPDTIDNESMFVNTLIDRFSYKPLTAHAPKFSIENEIGETEIFVNTYKETLELIIYSILEYYALNKSNLIKIKLYTDESNIKISFFSDTISSFPLEKINFYNILIDDSQCKIEFINSRKLEIIFFNQR